MRRALLAALVLLPLATSANAASVSVEYYTSMTVPIGSLSDVPITITNLNDVPINLDRSGTPVGWSHGPADFDPGSSVSWTVLFDVDVDIYLTKVAGVTLAPHEARQFLMFTLDPRVTPGRPDLTIEPGRPYTFIESFSWEGVTTPLFDVVWTAGGPLALGPTNTLTITAPNPPTVPEPAPIALTALALLAISLRHRLYA